MKRILLCAVLPTLLMLPAVPAHPQDAPAQIRQLFNRYIDAWNDGELMTIGSEIYRPPVQIFEAEQTRTLSSAQEIANLLAGVRAELDKAGFSHSELVDVSICELGGGLAFASFSYSRYDRAGRPIGPEALSSAYIVRQSADGWHLVAHVMQSRKATLSCST